jgi:hypothetical protein
MERAGKAERDVWWSFVGKKARPAVAVACDCSPHRAGPSVWVRTAQGRGLVAVDSAAGALRAHPLSYGAWGRVHVAAGRGGASPGHTPAPEERAYASDVAAPDATLGTEDALLLANHADARHRPWLVCQPLCFARAVETWPSPLLEHYPKMICAMQKP